MLYVDDSLVISEKGEAVIRKEIVHYFKVKPESVGPLNIYFGGKMCKVQIETGAECWAF